MRSFGQILSGTTPVWSKIPMAGKIVIVAGTIILAGSELTQIVNEAWRSSRIYEGNAAQGDSQSNPDVVKTLADLQSGKPTPAATATIAVTYEKTEAEAKRAIAERDAAIESETTLRARDAQAVASSTEQMRLRELDLKARDILLREREIALRESENSERSAIAAVANISEQELLAKLRKGIKLNSTENLRLSEIRQRRAEAGLKEWELFPAGATAITQKKAAEWGSRIFDSMGNGGQGTARAMSDMRRQIYGR
jgi:hypothetical protein